MVAAPPAISPAVASSYSGTQFTCFAGTNVQILTLLLPRQLSASSSQESSEKDQLIHLKRRHPAENFENFAKTLSIQCLMT
jgi:hypothetical protein